MTPKIKDIASIVGTVVITLALIALLTHYVFAAFQPVRWPTRYYFYGMFLIALCFTQRTAIMIFVFSLPILPDFHIQLEALWRPSVKYFVGHPGVDVVAGFCLGLWAKGVWQTKKIWPVFERLHWALGSLVIVITISVVLAVMRNVSVNNILDLSYLQFADNLVRFKLINYSDNYQPVADWMSYCFAILTICVLTPKLKKLEVQQREQVIFVPLMYGLILSAVWGIFQSLTGFGLSQTTLDYRPASIGFGAQGFQPDIHAFAAVMLIGTVGLLGFLIKQQGRDRYVGMFCIGICWVALILSKSKASLLLALLSSVIFITLHLKTEKIHLKKIVLIIFTLLSILSILLFLTKSFAWIDYFVELLFAPGSSLASNINKAFVYRPELFRAALLMFADSPIFGIGQGNFFKMSINVDLTHSVYMAQKGGENAHNYFLQTLAETGLIGALAFSLAIAWPFFQNRQASAKIAPTLALISIALGNVYSHSLLIRPNLILLAVILALTYASVETSVNKQNPKGMT